jgi:hypothetical protein
MYEKFGQGDEPVKVADLQPVSNWAGSPPQCLSLPKEREARRVYLSTTLVVFSSPTQTDEVLLEEGHIND